MNDKPTREEIQEAAAMLAELAGAAVMRLNNPLALLRDDRTVLGLGSQCAALIKAALLSPEWAGAVVAKVEHLERFRPEGETGTITLEEGARFIMRHLPVSMVIEPS